MSDLLTRLAQRALGAAPAVQPLLRSRYEAPAPGFAAEDAVPSPLAETSPPAVAESGAQDASTHSPQDARTPRTVLRRSPSPEVSAVPASPPPSSIPHASTEDDGLLLPPAPDERLPLRVSPATAESAEPPRQRGDASGPAARHNSAPTPAPLPRAESSTTAASAEHQDHGEARDAGRSIRPQTPRQVTSSAVDEDDDLLFPVATSAEGIGAGETDAVRWGDDETGATDGLVSPVHGSEANDPDGTREPGTTPQRARALRPAVAARAAAQPVRGERSDRIGPADSAEDTRPVVRVSIGRIEVRTVAPPPAPPAATRPAWKPPVLSLGDYLKRGSGR